MTPNCQLFHLLRYTADAKPWDTKCDIAIPCATQNEIEVADAKQLISNGVKIVVEAANMPTTADATAAFEAADILIGPAKAANAGGVAVSGLEMAQNSDRLSWTREEVDQKLKKIMTDIYRACKHGAAELGRPGDLRTGANIAGFIKVADSVLAQGVL